MFLRMTNNSDPKIFIDWLIDMERKKQYFNWLQISKDSFTIYVC